MDEDGAPITGARVVLFVKYIRSETQIGEANTSKQGQYSIAYHRPSALNLMVRAYDASGKVIAQSATVFAAPAQVEINLTTAANGTVATPSTFTAVQKAIAALLHPTWLGRWLNPDPAGMVEGVNTYQFIRSCPIGFLDRSGTDPEHPEMTKPSTDYTVKITPTNSS